MMPDSGFSGAADHGSVIPPVHNRLTSFGLQQTLAG